MFMKAFALGGLFLSAAPGLSAASPDLWDKYNNLTDRSDTYVGEGLAKASEFSGDANKALQAARQRAREDLASAVRVQVSSQTSESLELKGGKATEAFSSQGQ